MKFAVDYFIAGLNSGTAFNVNGEYAVGTRGSCVQVVLAEGTIQFTFEQTVERILFRITNVLLEALYKDTTARIVCNLQILIILHRLLRSLSVGE